MLEAKGGNARILRNTGDSLEVTIYKDGAPAPHASPAPTVTVTRADGTVFVTDAAVSGTNPYTYTLTPAQTAELEMFTADWKATVDAQRHTFTTHHEVVGAHLVTEKEVRAFDGGAMADDPPYTDALIRQHRDNITDRLEQATGVSWVPRHARVRLNGSATNRLQLPHLHINRIQSVTVDGNAFNQAALDNLEAYPSGLLINEAGSWWSPGYRNIVVEYEHGHQRLVDAVDRICLLWMRYTLVETNVAADRVLITDAAGNTYRRAERVPSGIPEVDDWIREHRDDRLNYGTVAVRSSIL